MRLSQERHSTAAHRRWQFELTDPPAADFGLAKRLRPHRAVVEEVDSSEVGRRLTVRLEALNRNGIPMHGTWGAPRATSLHPEDYGYGGAGHVDDLPAELVAELLRACGITVPTGAAHESRTGRSTHR